MKEFKLNLTDAEGIVICQWTIGNELEPEYDIEDLDSEPKHDFYLDPNYNANSDFGEAIVRECNVYMNN